MIDLNLLRKPLPSERGTSTNTRAVRHCASLSSFLTAEEVSAVVQLTGKSGPVYWDI